MDGLHSPGRIVDGEHQQLLPGRVSDILLHDGAHDWLRRGWRRGVRRLRAARENERRSKNPKVRHGSPLLVIIVL
jgi:hypothetical protein